MEPSLTRPCGGDQGGPRSVAQTVCAIIARQALLNLDAVTPGATLDSLGLDSLALVESLFAIEEAFDITIPFNAADPAQAGFDISTVGAIIAGVEALIAAK